MEPKFKGQHMEPAPPPMIINEEEEYEIEEIRKHWKREKGVQYLVHWKGYVLWNALDTNIFLLSIFLDFIFLFFSFEFLFLFLFSDISVT